MSERILILSSWISFKPCPQWLAVVMVVAVVVLITENKLSKHFSYLKVSLRGKIHPKKKKISGFHDDSL